MQLRWVAARLLGPEVCAFQDVGQLVIVALVFGVVNALIRPVVNLFTCLLNLLTLGLFTFIINTDAHAHQLAHRRPTNLATSAGQLSVGSLSVLSAQF